MSHLPSLSRAGDTIILAFLPMCLDQMKSISQTMGCMYPVLKKVHMESNGCDLKKIALSLRL